MANVFESISLEGLRIQHLEQLLHYAERQFASGEYYGNKKHFIKRHDKIIEWLKDACEYGRQEGVVFPKERSNNGH